jgi:hypothetical protein
MNDNITLKCSVCGWIQELSYEQKELYLWGKLNNGHPFTCKNGCGELDEV